MVQDNDKNGGLKPSPKEESKVKCTAGSEGHTGSEGNPAKSTYIDKSASNSRGEVNIAFVNDEGVHSKESLEKELSSAEYKFGSAPSPKAEIVTEELSPSHESQIRQVEPPYGNESQIKQDEPLRGNNSQIRQVEPPDGNPSSSTEDLKHTSGETETTSLGLKRELGLWNGVGIIVGIIIGSGIFVSPGNVLRNTGSIGMAMIIWVLTGIMSIVGALCFAELGTMIPESGSPFIYVYEGLGPIPAFLVLWINITIQRPSSRSINAITFATYLLQPIFPSCMSPPYYAVRIVGAAMLCLLGFINCEGMKFGKRIQDFFALLKVLSLIIIITAGFVHLIGGHTENLLDPMAGTSESPTAVASALYSTLFAYSGWYSLNTLTEELRDPYRNLPRAIAISISTVIVVYILANIAYFAVLTPEEIQSSSAVAVTFGSRFFGPLALLISFLVACSTFGNTNGNVITQSRLMFVAARKGQLPRFLTLIHTKKNTPVTSIICTVTIPLILLVVPDLGSLMAYTSFTRNLTELLCVVSLLWLRYKNPDRPRPIKVWLGFPILYLALTLFVAIFPVVQRPLEIGVAVGVFMAGFVVYYFAIYCEFKFIGNAMDKVTYFCVNLFQCVEEQKARKLS